MKRIKVFLLAMASCAFCTTASAQNVNEITVNDDRSGRKEVIELPEGMTLNADSLLNEWHAKNTSQKVRNVFKSKGMSGAPLTTNPPFGYLKDPESRNGWSVDEEAAKTVR